MNGEGDLGYSTGNGYVEAALSIFPKSEDGKSAVIDEGIVLIPDEVVRWYDEYADYDRRFRRWCKTHVRGSADAMEVFGITRGMLDDERMEISWPSWFADCVITYCACQRGTPAASLRLVDQLKEQLDFECRFRLDGMGNPALYPGHMFMIQALSGMLTGSATRESLQNMGHIYNELTKAWSADAQAQEAVQAMCRNAAVSTAECAYDPKMVFQAFRADVAQWAQLAFPEELHAAELEGGGFEEAVDRLAMAQMIDHEKDMVTAIGEVIGEDADEAALVTKERIRELSGGHAATA